MKSVGTFALVVAVVFGGTGLTRAVASESGDAETDTTLEAPALTTSPRKARAVPPPGVNPGDLPTGLPGFGMPARSPRPGEAAPSAVVPQLPAEE